MISAPKHTYTAPLASRRASWLPRREPILHVRRRTAAPAKANKGSSEDPYTILNVSPRSTAAEIKASYRQLMKQLHPDLNPDEDTTELATRLNAAYGQLVATLGADTTISAAVNFIYCVTLNMNYYTLTDSCHCDLPLWASGLPCSTEEYFPPDPFDFPEADATEIFVNPFACYGVPPGEWETLQEIAYRATSSGIDPEVALQTAGAGASPSAIVFLTPVQRQLILEELDRMGPAPNQVTAEACAYVIADCLYRARIANGRVDIRR